MEMAPVAFLCIPLEEDGTDHLFKLAATPCNTKALLAGQATDPAPLERVPEIVRKKSYRCRHRGSPPFHSLTQVNRMFHRGGKIAWYFIKNLW
jgi:hypothetical protein